MTTGFQSETGAIESVVLRHVRDAFVDPSAVDRQWRGLGYLERPAFDAAIREYDGFVELLRGFGIDVRFLDSGDDLGLDALYVRDAAVVCDRGVVLCRMGKEQRRAEPEASRATFETWGLPVAGAIEGGGRLEGGDVVWLDPRTIAVGLGYRTNREGIRQLECLLEGDIDELIEVPLPHWRGESDVFHLMSILSPLDTDLALVYSPLMPAFFRRRLIERGIELVEVPEEELDTLGCNVLAVSPRRCVMVRGNPRTRDRLRSAGVDVHEFDGNEICTKGSGGPTCLTRPLRRGLRRGQVSF